MPKATPKVTSDKALSLDDWLQLVFHPSKHHPVVTVCFPSDKHLEEYLASIQMRSEDDVTHLLEQFLIHSQMIGSDRIRLQSLGHVKKDDPALYNKMMTDRFYKRLTAFAAGHSDITPWEGNTWILDLLPHHPDKALQGLDAYIMAHMQRLSDNQIHGLSDAGEIIRARYIGLPGTHSQVLAYLMKLGPRDFECIVERLYNAMGYDTLLTPPKGDGGRDVIATKAVAGKREHLLVECKLYAKSVPVAICRALMGVVSDEKATKGVLVTTGRFTVGGKRLEQRNPRLELIAGAELAPLLNQHLGANWPSHVQRLVLNAQSPGLHKAKE